MNPVAPDFRTAFLTSSRVFAESGAQVTRHSALFPLAIERDSVETKSTPAFANSVAIFAKLPGLSESPIRIKVNRVSEEGVIVNREFSASKFSRTCEPDFRRRKSLNAAGMTILPLESNVSTSLVDITYK